MDQLLERGLHLDNLCVYDELLRSETSFHCKICNRCVEMFDHHCPFINNCLGSRNHKYFLIFVFGYLLFLSTLTIESVRHVTEIYMDEATTPIVDYMWPLILIALILMNVPILGFQIKAQCKALCKNN